MTQDSGSKSISVHLANRDLLFRDINFTFCVTNGFPKFYTEPDTNLTSLNIILYLFIK